MSLPLLFCRANTHHNRPVARRSGTPSACSTSSIRRPLFPLLLTRTSSPAKAPTSATSTPSRSSPSCHSRSASRLAARRCGVTSQARGTRGAHGGGSRPAQCGLGRSVRRFFGVEDQARAERLTISRCGPSFIRLHRGHVTRRARRSQGLGDPVPSRGRRHPQCVVTCSFPRSQRADRGGEHQTTAVVLQAFLVKRCASDQDAY